MWSIHFISLTFSYFWLSQLKNCHEKSTFFSNWELQITIFQKSIFSHTWSMWNFNIISNLLAIPILNSPHIDHAILHYRILLTKKARRLYKSILPRLRIMYDERWTVNQVTARGTRRIFASSRPGFFCVWSSFLKECHEKWTFFFKLRAPNNNLSEMHFFSYFVNVKLQYD